MHRASFVFHHSSSVFSSVVSRDSTFTTNVHLPTRSIHHYAGRESKAKNGCLPQPNRRPNPPWSPPNPPQQAPLLPLPLLRPAWPKPPPPPFSESRQFQKRSWRSGPMGRRGSGELARWRWVREGRWSGSGAWVVSKSTWRKRSVLVVVVVADAAAAVLCGCGCFYFLSW